jgi:hypothetical protein
MSFSPPRGLTSLSLRGILWIAVAAIVSLSYILYTPEPAARGMQPGVADWIFRSWPALFASALGMWLLLSGPVVNAPRWVQKGARLAMVFFVYSGFLFLLRWNPFWAWMNALGFTNRNTDMGVLILVATIFWILARRGNLWVSGERQRAASVRNRRNFRQVESNDLCWSSPP